jgi:hypothetical protein
MRRRQMLYEKPKLWVEQLQIHNCKTFKASFGSVKLPAASRGASVAQLEFKLRRPLL